MNSIVVKEIKKQNNEKVPWIRAEGYVTFDGELTSRFQVVTKKNSSDLMTRFPSDSYVGKDGQRKYKTIVELVDTLYHKANKVILEAYENVGVEPSHVAADITSGSKITTIYEQNADNL